MPKSPKTVKPRNYDNPQSAIDAVADIYESHRHFLQERFQAFIKGDLKRGERVRACYPYFKITTSLAKRSDTRMSFGFAPRPGIYQTTVTRPDIFEHYYRRQLELILRNHDVPIEVGVSDTPIPIHFSLGESLHLEADLTHEQVRDLPDIFDVPDLRIMDDDIANGSHVPLPEEPEPLSLFTAPRVDLSLQRLKHYTGTSPKHFQNFVIFTNYQFYIDEFIKICQGMMQTTNDSSLKKKRSEYVAFVEPGDVVTSNRNLEKSFYSGPPGQAPGRMPQMPAYHLVIPGGQGITMVNIGVGPSNAKTITDHIAVLRPHAWLMLGHCAGLRNSQQLGDYVLAHGYLREDRILDAELPLSIPVPALAEIQQALEQAVAQVTEHSGFELKKVMRTGTVATTMDRNWELRSSVQEYRRLSQSRAIAMDMESGTIAANGFRFRVPYGTLLCVSDKPLHGQLKLPGMADSFYRERVDQHLQVGLLTMALLRDLEPARLHSRKLRSFNEVAFQ